MISNVECFSNKTVILFFELPQIVASEEHSERLDLYGSLDSLSSIRYKSERFLLPFNKNRKSQRQYQVVDREDRNEK